MQRLENLNYGQKIQQSVEEQLAEKKRQQEQQQLDKFKYKKELEKQMEDTNKRKLYRDVMSEHERKINRMDLLAYENLRAELYSNIIGVRNLSTVVILHNKCSRQNLKNQEDRNFSYKNPLSPIPLRRRR